MLLLLLAWRLRFEVASRTVRDLFPAVPISSAAIPSATRFPPFTPCSVSVPWTCPPPHWTWTQVDIWCGLAFIAFGLILTGIQLQEAGAHPPMPKPANPPASYIARMWDMGLEEAREFLRILMRVLWPPGHHKLLGLIVAFGRIILWPAFTIVAADAAVAFARYIQAALHHTHDPANPLSNALPHVFELELPMLLWSGVSLGCIALATIALAGNPKFLVDVGGRVIKQVFVLALALWAFGGTLLLVNLLVLLLLHRAGVSKARLANSDVHPFDLGLLSLLSFVLLLIFVGAFVLGTRPSTKAGKRLGGSWWWRRFLAWWNKPLKRTK